MTRAFATATLLAALTALSLPGCGGAPLRLASIDEMEHVRAAPAAQEGAKLAPEAYARAEHERALALAAHQAGDDVGATLHAQRAVAAYDHALVVARLARATAELADAQKSLDDASGQAQALEASHAQLDRDAEDLEQRVRIARERLLPAQSAVARGEREGARLVAARSLAVEARLLCDAARLVAADATSLADADAELAKIEDRLEKAAHPAPIDESARARAHCLDVLTRARRAAGADAGASDALLSELSAGGGWDPVRDERGVVITLHDAFHGAEPTGDAAARLKELGRIAGAHPGFALQVVVHDAQPPAAKGSDDARRAAAAVQALVGGGAAAGKIKTELAGARAPIVDPGDARGRARNERLDVVFVASGK